MKQTILRMIARLPDDTSVEQMIDAIRLRAELEVGIRQCERGEFYTLADFDAEFGARFARGETTKGCDMTTKDVAREVLEHLPEGLSLQQIAYEIYVRGEVAEGRAEIERGEGVPHEEAVREIRRWFR